MKPHTMTPQQVSRCRILFPRSSRETIRSDKRLEDLKTSQICRSTQIQYEHPILHGIPTFADKMNSEWAAAKTEKAQNVLNLHSLHPHKSTLLMSHIEQIPRKESTLINSRQNVGTEFSIFCALRKKDEHQFNGIPEMKFEQPTPFSPITTGLRI